MHRERKIEKLFEKVTLKSPICLFKKLDSWVSIDQKSASIDRNRQRLSLSNLKFFDWSKNRMDWSK